MKKLNFLWIFLLTTIISLAQTQDKIYLGINNGGAHNIDLYSMDGNGNNLQFIYSSIKEADHFTVSDDNSKFLFSSSESSTGSRELFIMDADGTNKQQITTNSAEWGSVNPLFYSETKIWYLRNSRTKEWWEMNYDGSEQRQLTNWEESGGSSWAFDFNKARTKITYCNTGSGGLDLYICDIDLTNEKRLTNDGNYDDAVRFSPDGSKITWQKVAGALNVWIIDSDGSNSKPLTNVPDHNYCNHPMFSNDGSKIYYTYTDNDLHRDIYVVNIDGTSKVNLTNTPSVNEFLLWVSSKSNQSPIADAGEDQTVECTVSSGTSVTLDGTGSSDPDGDDLTYSWTWDEGTATGANPVITLSSGITPIILVVNDGTVDSEPDTVIITVEETSPPVIIIGNEMITLWPPNHTYQLVELNDFNITVEDGCDNGINPDDLVITSVSSDEEENGNGDGDTDNDIVMVSCQKVKLIKERDGNGNGRVYTINIGISDGSGNIATAECYVTVPHNNGSNAVDDGVVYSVEGCGIDLPIPIFAVNVTEDENVIPEEYKLVQNYPNPFNPTTQIRFGIPQAGNVTLKIYNSVGQLVKTLVDGNMSEGYHQVTWDATDNSGSKLSSGVYFYSLTAGSFTQVNKMLLLK